MRISMNTNKFNCTHLLNLFQSLLSHRFTNYLYRLDTNVSNQQWIHKSIVICLCFGLAIREIEKRSGYNLRENDRCSVAVIVYYFIPVLLSKIHFLKVFCFGFLDIYEFVMVFYERGVSRAAFWAYLCSPKACVLEIL